MKRYRVLSFQFDTRANILTMEIQDGWTDPVRETWLANKREIAEGLVSQFGERGADQKRQNFVALGPMPISVLAFHNRFLAQVRDAFVIGSYYPALTGAGALGERILNHLILRMRPHFKSRPEYKTVHRKQSFHDWDQAVSVLRSWSVLRPEVVPLFKKLERARNRAVHFSPETDENDREMALQAVALLQEIVALQFGAIGPLPWFIPNTRGGTYLKKAVEDDPFIREVYLPACVRVGPNHKLAVKGGRFVLERDGPYADLGEVTDAEYARLLEVAHR